MLTERAWFERAAADLVANKGTEAAARVAAFHRRSPMPGAEFYPELVEMEIAKAKQEAAV